MTKKPRNLGLPAFTGPHCESVRHFAAKQCKLHYNRVGCSLQVWTFVRNRIWTSLGIGCNLEVVMQLTLLRKKVPHDSRCGAVKAGSPIFLGFLDFLLRLSSCLSAHTLIEHCASTEDSPLNGFWNQRCILMS